MWRREYMHSPHLFFSEKLFPWRLFQIWISSPGTTTHIYIFLIHQHQAMPIIRIPFTSSGHHSLDGIQCSYNVDECKFLLVCPCVGVHRKMLITCSYLLHQQSPTYLPCLGLFVEVSGCTAAVLWVTASRIRSK